MLPLIFPGRLGEYYQLHSRGHSAFPCGDPISNTDAAFLFWIITRELLIPTDQWRSVLMRLGVSIPPNFFHAHNICDELVKLFQRGELYLVKIPRLENIPVMATEDAWGYCFIRGPQLHPSTSYSPVNIQSFDEAQAFLDVLNVGEKELRLYTHRNPALASFLGEGNSFLQRCVEGLANRSILAYKVPVLNVAPPVKALEYVAATAIDREVPLAPETIPAPTRIGSTLSARKGVPPKSMEDAESRLRSMKQEIDANGHLPKYSDAQLLQQAQAGEVARERYHVRFMEVGHQWDRSDTIRDPNNLTGKLGREFSGETGTGPRYWSTTFDQIEDADTDAKLICEKLGIDHDPTKKYIIAIIDTDKAKPLTGCECVAATFENISEFSNRELPKKFPKEFTDEVMNSEFQEIYKAHYKAARDDGFLESDWSTDTKRFAIYLDTTDLKSAQKESLLRRMEMHDKIGNNQHYLGNGVTKNKIAGSPNKYGIVETHNFERTPTNLQKLKDNNAIRIISL